MPGDPGGPSHGGGGMDGAVIRFAGVRRPLWLVGCSELEPLIDEVCEGWPHRRAALRDAGERPGRPAITVRRAGGAYQLTAPDAPAPVCQGDPVAAVCDIVVHLVHGWVAAHRRRLCLHAGAVRIGGRLVVFPSAYRSGKSVLVTHLAALGHEVFGDDVLPLEAAVAARGMALGVAPRLRLPLPETFDGRARAFLGTRRGAEGARYVYVRTDDGPFARYGRTAPIGALVHLERRAGAEAELSPMAPGEMLRRVVARNFARARPAPDILARIEAMVRRAPCYRLRYDAPGAAAALLGAQFASWRRRHRVAGGRTRAIACPARDVADAPPGSHVVAPGISARQWGDDVFLVDAAADSIYHLDPIAAALWRQCAAPMTEAALADLMAAAFPDTPPGAIAADVARLMKGLRTRGLVRRLDAPTSSPLRGRSPPSARCG